MVPPAEYNQQQLQQQVWDAADEAAAEAEHQEGRRRARQPWPLSLTLTVGGTAAVQPWWQQRCSACGWPGATMHSRWSSGGGRCMSSGGGRQRSWCFIHDFRTNPAHQSNPTLLRSVQPLHPS